MDAKQIEEKIDGKFSERMSSGFLKAADYRLDCETLLKNFLDTESRIEFDKFCGLYIYAANKLVEVGYYPEAALMVEKAWNAISEHQLVNGCYAYRAALGAYLARNYLRQGDQGAAVRWALLTHAEDLLAEHHDDGGDGKHLLKSFFGMPDKAHQELKDLAKDNRKAFTRSKSNWSDPAAFGEDVVVKLCTRMPELASGFFALPSSKIEFPRNTAYFKALLDAAKSNASSSNQRGRILEHLATYLFLLLPGLAPRKNVEPGDRVFENDLVVRNLMPTSNAVGELLGRYFLVECKNRKDPVPTKDAGYFLYRMRLVHARFGVMIAVKGETGSGKNIAAESLRRRAFHEDDCTCVVISMKALEELRDDGMCSFWAMLVDRIEDLRFGRDRARSRRKDKKAP